MFEVGQKVICIESRWGATVTGGTFQRSTCPNLPRVGSIYTIRTVEIIPIAGGPVVCHVRLIEVVNPMNAQGTEPVFQGRQFRPLDERRPDISFAYDILKGGKVDA